MSQPPRFTDSQRKVARAIDAAVRTLGISPTAQGLAEITGMTQRAVEKQIGRMCASGKLSHKPHETGSLRLTQLMRDHLKDAP